MENKLKALEDGKYVVEIQAIKKDSDETSAMDPYLARHAIISKEAEKTYLTIMIQEANIVTDFKLEDKQGNLVNCLEQKIDEAKNNRYEIFEFYPSTSALQARVQYEVDHEGSTFKGDEQFRLLFDLDSIKNIKDFDI